MPSAPIPAKPTVPAAARWVIRGRVLELDRPRIVGVLNVTPDSFSDGGRYVDRDAALAQASRLVEEGADIIDIGGESTRPQGAKPVSTDEEARRVVPVVEAIRLRFPEQPLSIDTVKSQTAQRVLEAGADIINDVSAFRLDARMADVCAETGAGVILMHSRGSVTDMATYAHATYARDVIDEVAGELGERVDAARAAGIDDDRIALDPGVGFSKRSEHSIRVIAHIQRIVALGFPVVVGASRKRFVGELSRVTAPDARVNGTIAVNLMALTAGARLFRVHDVRPTREALDVAWAILREREAAP